MARFLEEAKKELEGEIQRAEKRKSPRKNKTPPSNPSTWASSSSKDYHIVRLAPHKHILGKLEGYLFRI